MALSGFFIILSWLKHPQVDQTDLFRRPDPLPPVTRPIRLIPLTRHPLPTRNSTNPTYSADQTSSAHP